MSSYISGQYDTDDGFIALRKHIEEREGNREQRNRYRPESPANALYYC